MSGRKKNKNNRNNRRRNGTVAGGQEPVVSGREIPPTEKDRESRQVTGIRPPETRHQPQAAGSRTTAPEHRSPEAIRRNAGNRTPSSAHYPRSEYHCDRCGTTVRVRNIRPRVTVMGVTVGQPPERLKHCPRCDAPASPALVDAS